ncbi:MAG: arginine N-succinyltransferase [Oleiphilaceae bacterium]|nr:arginine N-succinyltransferase [Oleiphilaceae bacterium]
MMLVRPCRAEDLADIETVVNQNRSRISSLPHDRDKLSERIDHSIRSFEQDPEVAGQELFLLVLEDTDKGQVVGTAGINMNRDKRRPFYNYRLDELIHSSPKLGVHTAVPVLYLTHELTGNTALSSFSIKEEYRQSEYFDLLARSRLLFMRQFRDMFSEQVVVEIQGVHGENDASVFWDSLGRHFFDMDFATADYYSGVKSRTFIAEMMPQHPIYVPLLTQAAQDVLGEADPRTERTCKLLYKEGFKKSKYVDIFDGGPTLIADLERLQTVSQAQQKQVRCSDVHTGLRYLVANHSFDDFRCAIAQITDGIGDILRIDAAAADFLRLQDGDSMSYAPL